MNWIPYQHKKTKIIVYYNHKTGEVSQDHPMDAYYRSLYQKLKQDPSLLIQVKLLTIYYFREISKIFFHHQQIIQSIQQMI